MEKLGDFLNRVMFAAVLWALAGLMVSTVLLLVSESIVSALVAKSIALLIALVGIGLSATDGNRTTGYIRIGTWPSVTIAALVVVLLLCGIDDISDAAWTFVAIYSGVVVVFSIIIIGLHAIGDSSVRQDLQDAAASIPKDIKQEAPIFLGIACTLAGLILPTYL